MSSFNLEEQNMININNILVNFPILHSKAATFATKKEISKRYEEIFPREYCYYVDILDLKTIYELNTFSVDYNFNINILNSSKMQVGDIVEFTIIYLSSHIASGYNISEPAFNEEFANTFVLNEYIQGNTTKHKITLIRKSYDRFVVYSELSYSNLPV